MKQNISPLSIDECLLNTTESICPVCLKRIPAKHVLLGNDVYLDKECPEHGHYRTILWRGQNPGYADWFKERGGLSLPDGFAPKEGQGCPYECGLCAEHRNPTCCILLEVTQRCNQNCSFCFAESGGEQQDPPYEEIIGWLEFLRDAGKPFIHFTGGEPTLRDDLPELISAAKAMGFAYIQLNTNGRRLAEDKDYVAKLREAGLSSVFLQFDGTTSEIYRRIRGEDLLSKKEKAIENCAENMLGVVLVPTLVPGINTENIGEIINFGLARSPYVRGVHFQPVSYFGRFPAPPKDRDRITLPEVIQAIVTQTGKNLASEHFGPTASCHALCSFHGDFVVMPDGGLKPLRSSLTNSEPCACCGKTAVLKNQNFVARRWELKQPSEIESEDNRNRPELSLGEWDAFISRVRSHGFTITGMAFQDCWNLDLDRLKSCSLHVLSKDKKIVPFCAYYLTNCEGNSLYKGSF